MTTTHAKTIAVFESPLAFKSNPAAQKFWNASVKSRINGWGIVMLERHRVSAIKGISIVHFAPQGCDLNNPVDLSDVQMAAALQAAKEWCKANPCAVNRESILEMIHEEIKKAVRAITSLRKEVLNAECLDDKLDAHGRMKELQATLTNRRLKIFAAEDAMESCIRDHSMEPFKPLSLLFPQSALLVEHFLKKQPVAAIACA